MNRKKFIGARIKQARSELGLSQKELGKLYGCSDVNISEIERGLTGISIPDLERIAEIVGKPITWFLQDEVQSMPRPPAAALSDLEVSIRAYIPVYAEVSAGTGTEPVDYVACTRVKAAPESYRAYRVKGLCLEPEIKDGDTLIVDTALEPRDGDLVVVIIEGQASVKYYHEKDNGSNHLYVHEGKTEYKYLENNHGKFTPEEVHLHGVVVEHSRRRR
jgi:transcriptional regulator with XRE-family HTH domain